MLAMLITELPGCMTRPQACATQYAPLRLTSITERNCSGVSRVAGCAVPTPALLINTSPRPKVCIAASTSAWHCSGSLTSVAMVSALRPPASTREAVSANLSTRRAPNTTSAPASANAWANDTPSPDEAPVTITTLSSSRNESSTPMRKTPLLSSCRPARSYEATARQLVGRDAARRSGEAPDQPAFGGTGSWIFRRRVRAAVHPANRGQPGGLGCPEGEPRLRCSEQNRAWGPRRCDNSRSNRAGTYAGGNGMSEAPRRRSRRFLWLLSLPAVVGLGLGTTSAYASPLTPPAPQDSLAAVGQVGP